MSDWRTMQAGRELDRVISRRLGYRIAVESTAEHWSTDLNVALALGKPILWFADGQWFAGFDAAVFATFYYSIFVNQPVGIAETPALAICRAFLAWKESQELKESNGNE